MELRHLRYFIAVAEAGSLKLAAEKRLHTAQRNLRLAGKSGTSSMKSAFRCCAAACAGLN
jgi:hypothetical protein